MLYQLGFIGGGNMAEAIVHAAIHADLFKPESLIVSDPTEARRRVLAELGVAVTSDNQSVIEQSATIVLATKPQIAPSLLTDFKGRLTEDQIVISIMAGLTTERIESAVLGGPGRIVRVMPNTPLLAGAGMSAICLGRHARAGDEQLALLLFGAAGEAIVVEEKEMDAVTAVSGSGPAYLFLLAEAMGEAAGALDLPESSIELLVRQTLLGAAKLLKESDLDASELRRRVTSPGGTTQAAIERMIAGGVPENIVAGVKAAADRSRALASE